mmetsp:Transcript_64993/g.128389  ORF Transcript_64993/g.128389 Transcript_64993/m.128389 type:complete len:230 (-) Transcript_64993:389-1078(-)
MLHCLNNLSAVLTGHTWVVFHIDTFCHQLAAHGRRNDKGTKVGPSSVDGCCHSRWSATNNHNLLNGTRCSITVEAAWVVHKAPLFLFNASISCLFLTALQLLLELLQRCRLEAGALLASAASCRLFFALGGCSLPFGGLGSLAIFFLQQPHHGSIVIAVLFDDLVNVFWSSLGCIMLLIKCDEVFTADLHVVLLELLDEASTPFSKRVLICARKLVALFALHPELECGH